MPATEFKVIFEGNVPGKMRDGVVLRSDIWRPDAPGQYPVILVRTPYDKTSYVLRVVYSVEPIRAVQQGYVVIMQDTRGRYASDGDYRPYMDDFNDGYDTVEWAASLPYSNGNVGMMGASYYAGTQWLAALQQPPHLKAIFPTWFADSGMYTGGALQLGLFQIWGYLMAADALKRKLLAGQRQVAAYLPALMQALDNMPSAYEKLPLKGGLPFMSELVASYDEWLDHPGNDPYWTTLGFSASLEKVMVPAYNLAGWFDLFSGAQPALFSAMRQRGGSEAARKGQKLIIGPWAHGASSDQFGDIYFGTTATLAGVDIGAVHLRWFDYWLKGAQNGIMDEPPIKIFVMGANKWRFENEWPLARTQWTDYFLHSSGNANSRSGDGILSPVAPTSDEPVDRYVYDPHNPVPTLGGCTALPGASVVANAGPKEQSPVETRSDVLVYTSQPLEQDIEVTGPVTVTLFAATSAADTDWTAKLVDVHPDGSAYNLADGILRARYRSGTEELLEPGAIYEYKIDLQATSNVFKKGHCFRVQVSSSNFPRFDRNPNTGRTIATETELIPASQTVYHDPGHLSCITLPLIPAA